MSVRKAPSLLLAIVALLNQAPVFAQDKPQDKVQDKTQDKKYFLKEPEPVGSLTRMTIASSNAKGFPLDRPYSRFTPEEKERVRDEYENMPENDEPPFPENGLGPILEDVATLISKLSIEGELSMVITVDSKGKASNVKFLKYPDLEAAKSIAYVFVKAKYKPAVCSGQPCKMDFPFRTLLQLKQ